MKIKVIGSGCPTCKKLHLITEEAVKEAGIDAEVEYSTNIQEIVELGLMQSPVLVVDGKPVNFKSFNVKGVKEAILGTTDKNCSNGGCSCGGKC